MCDCSAGIDILSEILSVVAIIISIASIWISHKTDIKIMRINLNEKYYSKIFDNYLLRRIPEKRSEMHFSDGELKGYNELCLLLSEMRNNAEYFKHQNIGFYNRLKKYIEDFEDIIDSEHSNIVDLEIQNEIINKIHKTLENIYKCIIDSEREEKIKY